MYWLITKYVVSAAVVVAVSEFAKRSDKLGALVAALPLVTLLTLFWLYFEGQQASKISNHAWYTFWFVIPTLPMFAVFPSLHSRFGFWGAVGASCVLTVVCFAGLAGVVRKFGVNLL